MKKIICVCMVISMALLNACGRDASGKNGETFAERNTETVEQNTEAASTQLEVESSSIQIDNQSEGADTELEKYTLGDSVEIQTAEGNFDIKVQNVHTVDWKVNNEGVKVVTVQAEVENISYSGYEDNKIQYYEIANSGISLLDEDGFDLEFYSISGGNDGKYEVGAIFDIGSKKRVSLPFLVPEECDTVSVSVDGHVSDPISLNN